MSRYTSMRQFGRLQVRLCDVEYGFPGIEALGREHLGVLGKTQSREALSQVAHVEGRRQVMSG